MIRRALPITQPVALHDIAATRTLEARAAATLPQHALMARAGDAVARLALAIAPHASSIWIAVGPGNNGGDGLEAAAHLQRAGKNVTLLLTGDDASLPPDAQAALALARAAGVRFAGAPDTSPDLAIDALLGIGARRPPEGAIQAAIYRLNALACPVLAVDVPSGLSADTGQPIGDACVRALHTITLLTLKPGLFTGSGRDYAGTVWLDTLGAELDSEPASAWLAGALPRATRLHAQHKGSFGDAVVVGGSTGMAGAALLAARAAHAAGAGRVFVDMLGRTEALDPGRPELMLRHGWSSASSPDVLKSSTVVCGCGGGDSVRQPLPRLLSLAGRLVLDADALNAIASDAGLLPLLRARAGRGLATVLTPHPLEAARLLACSTAEVQSDRLQAARSLAAHCNAVVVLKGSGTVVAAPAHTSSINSTGNASLASAGTGDVLAGWLGGRWAQLERGDEMRGAFDIAVQSVADHGAAAEPQPSGALLAGDLIERLHKR